MGREDEVIPDSQDEAEGHASQSFERDISPPAQHLPLTNATIPRSSSSYVLPKPTTAPSTISQFTLETVMNTEITTPSTISAFTSSDTTKKSRPRPRPTYTGANVAKDNSANDIRNLDGSVTSPSGSTSARTPYVLPPPQATFSTDISERIKARRAPGVRSPEIQGKQNTSAKTKEKAKKKKTIQPVEEVIVIDSDDILAGTSGPSAASKRPAKMRGPPQSPDPLNIGVVSPTAHLQRELETDIHDMSPPPPRKRKRNPIVPPDNLDPDAPGASLVTGGANSVSQLADEQGPARPPKKSKKVDDNGVEVREEKPKKKKKAQAKSQEGKKAHPKPQGKEKEQFKSSEFIVDSDDELSLGAEKGAGEAEKKLTSNSDASAAAVVASALVAASSKETKTGVESLRADVGITRQLEPLSKVKNTSKKRKATRDEAPVDAAGDEPPSKKTKRPDEASNPGTKKRHKSGEDKASGAVIPDKAIAEQRSHTSDVEEPIVKPMRKKSGRIVIEDEDQEDDEGAKENKVPAAPKASAPAVSVSAARAPSIQPLVSTPKPSCAHPPKNRPLSSILQRVNSASPRPRASPSMSRNLLTRIAPLHPNRRTPPPPPPPRIIPKKTKKELEREEKWEEELQETVEGWCELEEGERERMRRARRDWELGLCEE